jgi:hypothetical protein
MRSEIENEALLTFIRNISNLTNKLSCKETQVMLL